MSSINSSADSKRLPEIDTLENIDPVYSKENLLCIYLYYIHRLFLYY
jgi:hypothetical protein